MTIVKYSIDETVCHELTIVSERVHADNLISCNVQGGCVCYMSIVYQGNLCEREDVGLYQIKTEVHARLHSRLCRKDLYTVL